MQHLQRRRAVVAALAFAAAAGFAACADDSALAPADVAGSWTGATSQNQPVTLTVTNEGVSEGSFSYQMQGVCTFTATAVITTQEVLPIDGASFTTGKTQIGYDTFLTASGKFSSPTAATGTLTIAHGPCRDTLELTWHAAKH